MESENIYGSFLKLLCSLSREKVSISLDKDENSLRTFTHEVKASHPRVDLNPIFFLTFEKGTTLLH